MTTMMKNLTAVLIIVTALSFTVVLGICADKGNGTTVDELVKTLKTFETGINTKDIDMAMSACHPDISIQAGSAKKKLMYGWDDYKEHLAEWIQGVKELNHYDFRKTVIGEDRASFVCDANLMALSKKTGEWKMRTVLDITYEFAKEGKKWLILKRTY